MWSIFEHRRLDKQLAKVPMEVQKRYEKWKDIVEISGPAGLKLVRGFRRAKPRVRISPGESVRIMRELQELSQNQLAEAAGIPQSTISAIERERVNLGVERAKVLARALKCHPAVLVFPGWDAGAESAA